MGGALSLAHTLTSFVSCALLVLPPSHTRPSAINFGWNINPSRKGTAPNHPSLMTNASLVSAAAVVIHLCSRLPLLASAAAPLSLITPPTSLFGRQLQAVQAISSSSSTSALTAMTTTYEDFEAYDGGDYKIFVGRVSCWYIAKTPSEELAGRGQRLFLVRRRGC